MEYVEKLPEDIDSTAEGSEALSPYTEYELHWKITLFWLESRISMHEILDIFNRLLIFVPHILKTPDEFRDIQFYSYWLKRLSKKTFEPCEYNGLWRKHFTWTNQ